MTGGGAFGSGIGMRSFRSRLHPEGHSLPSLFGIRYLRPLTATMIPAMIVALVVVLQGGDVLQFMKWSFPGAMVIAAAWTWYRLKTVTVEFLVSERGACALTAYEAVVKGNEVGMQRVFDVRADDGIVEVTIGLTSLRLHRQEWSDLGELLNALEAARQYYS